MIKIVELTKKYGQKTVIDKLTMCLPDKGCIALCGVSGCGKSTLLSILAGIEKYNSGSVSPLPGTFSVSMSFQDPCLLPWRTAAENVNIVLGDKKETLPQALCLLQKLGIDSTDAYPDQLSGGMKARVGVARALARKSSVYLFDEPFAALDDSTAETVAHVIHEYTSDALSLMVIHNTEFARRIADTVITFDSVPLSTFTVGGVSVERL